MQRSSKWFVLAMALTAWAGCSAASDAPPAHDGGPQVDAAIAIDAEPPIDPPLDVDAAIAGDAAMELDASPAVDAATRADAGRVEPEVPDPVEPTPRRYVRFRVAAINAPESRKPGLIMPPLVRARRLLDWLVDNEVTAAAVQESGTYLQRAAAERPAWKTTYAPPNNVLADREIGNGIVYRGASLAILDTANLRVAMPGRPRGLSFPIRLVEHRADTDRRARFVMISFHAPTRRDDPSDAVRAVIRRELRTLVRRYQRAGLPVVLAGDANDGAYASHFRGDLEVAYHHGVDWILVSPEIRVHGGFSRAIPLLSDHDAITASISVPAASGGPRRLPN